MGLRLCSTSWPPAEPACTGAGRSMPVVSVGEAGFARLVGRSGAVVSVDGARVHLAGDHAPQPASPAHAPLSLLDAATEAATEAATDANAATAAVAAGAGEATAAAEAHTAGEADTGVAYTGVAYTGLRLSRADQAMLDGAHGRAAQVAIWGDIRRYSEIWGDIGRCREI